MAPLILLLIASANAVTISERFGLLGKEKPPTEAIAAAARWLLANTDYGFVATTGEDTFGEAGAYGGTADHADGFNSHLVKANGTGVPILCKWLYSPPLADRSVKCFALTS